MNYCLSYSIIILTKSLPHRQSINRRIGDFLIETRLTLCYNKKVNYMGNIYEKIFGKVKSGSNYSKKDNLGGSYNASSLSSSMNKFRNAVYGGLSGKNLSKQNADLIISVIEPHLKNLPIGGKLSYQTKMAMREKLWQHVLAGKLSKEDFDDAKKIIELF